MFYFIYHMTLKLIKTSHFWRENVKILPSVTQRYNGRHNVPRKSVHHYYRLYCIALYHSQTRRHVIKYLFSVFKIKLELLDSILLLSPAVIFFKSNFAKIIQEHYPKPNRLDPDQDRLGQKCLHRFSADD